jgi:tRNA/tmRNA/rRNA uracil-C5-methylase (TrmA/RlmC/RlmD family)
VVSLGLDRGWRTRVTLHADESGRLGFHAARSDQIVPVTACLQAAQELDLPEVLARDWPPGTDVHVSLSAAGRAVITRRPDGMRDLEGPAEHLHDVHGRLFSRAVDGFWQAHRSAPETLVDEVRELAGACASIVDLYAGVGLFGLSLLTADVERLVLVEGDRRAAAYARQNAAGDERVRVIGRDVQQWRATAADLVVLDPPRAGAGKGVVTAVTATGAATIVYVSCEPSTLARDLKLFEARGYRPDHLRGFDLFPGTAHVETVVRLRRGDA